MPLFIVYDPATGKQISSTGTDTPNCLDRDAISAKGLAIKEFVDIDEPNIPSNKQWNTSTLDLDDYTPPKRLRVEVLMNRLTDDELDALLTIRNDKATNAFLERIKHIRYIDPDDTKVQALFDFFIAQGAITAQRKTELLAEGE